MNKYDRMCYQKHAVVTYILEEDRILLIEKKRGLGAGKINVPGGHIEDGETPIEAAIRETKEEVNLEVSALEFSGYLYFHFTDGLTMKGYVYRTDRYSGEMKESDEAKPFWCNRDEIPYKKMWEDDEVWIPEMLKGRLFRAFFHFDGDKMIRREVEFYDSIDEFN